MSWFDMICYDLSVNISDIAIIIFKGIGYRCIFYDINKSEAIISLENSAFEDRGYLKKKCISIKSILKIVSTAIILTI